MTNEHPDDITTIPVEKLRGICGGADTFNDRWRNAMQDIGRSWPIEYSNRGYRARLEDALRREGTRRQQGG
jgi:hypothetical protein